MRERDFWNRVRLLGHMALLVSPLKDFEMTLTPYANKAPAIKALLEDIAPHKTGCATCGKPTGNTKDFRDLLSMREYKISRMCQVCQDRLFWVSRVVEVELDDLELTHWFESS